MLAHFVCWFYLFIGRGRDRIYNTRKGKSGRRLKRSDPVLKTNIKQWFNFLFSTRRANAVLPVPNILGLYFIRPSPIPEDKTDRFTNTKTDRQRQIKKISILREWQPDFQIVQPRLTRNPESPKRILPDDPGIFPDTAWKRKTAFEKSLSNKTYKTAEKTCFIDKQ